MQSSDFCKVCVRTVVPKPVGKLPPRGNMRFFWGERRITTTLLFCIMSDYCKINFRQEMQKILLRVIRHGRYLDSGNGSTKFGNRCVGIKSVVIFLTFQPFSFCKQLLRISLFEDLPQQNEVFLIWVSDRFLFRDVYCYSFGHDAIFISLQERCRRNN